MNKENKIWIIGCGDIGRRVATLYDKNTIQGIVSSAESAKLCKQQFIQAHLIDLDSKFTLENYNFANASIYYFVPPSSLGPKDTRLKTISSAVNRIAKRIVLISTTGVYGDSKGEWIDENTPVNPQADRAVRRLSAEQIMQRWALKTQSEFMILRVPGIYAEDRLPLARLENGLPIVNADEAGFTNRIHADDLAQACKAAMECETRDQIINITDGNPSTMTEYFNLVADYANLPRPPQISMQKAEEILSAGMVSYLKESRRIRNNKMTKILNFSLKYPNLAVALNSE